QLEREQAFAAVEDSTGGQASQHGSLGEKDGAKGVRTLAQESKTGAAIGVTRNEIQLQPGDVPKKTEPDKKSHVPAQQNELRNGQADKPVTDPGQVKCPPPASAGVPRRSADSDAVAPQPQAEDVDPGQEHELRRN